MPDELDVVARVTRFDAVDADGVPVGRVARPAAVEVVHGERRVRRDLVETLAAVDGLLHRVLVVEDLVPFANGRDARRQAKSTETVVEYLIELESGRGVVRYLDAGRQAVEYSIPPQDRVRLRRDQHSGLSVTEDIVLLQDALAAIKDTNAAISPIIDFVTLQEN